jgi:tetratricopeptide (TPR) repeat protein
MAKKDLYTAPRQVSGTLASTVVDNLPSGQDRLDEIVNKYQGSKKLVNGILFGLAAVVIGYFVYKQFVVKPNNEKAAEELSQASTFMLMDSLNWMVNGRNGAPGAKAIADKYSGTDAGNMACYMTGVGMLKQGNFKEAIKYLSKFDARGTMLTAVAAGSLGDAYWENKELDKATEAYERAGNELEDFQFAPLYLQRAAMIYEEQGKNDKAIAAYQKIKKEFPNSSVNREVDLNLARLGIGTDD